MNEKRDENKLNKTSYFEQTIFISWLNFKVTSTLPLAKKNTLLKCAYTFIIHRINTQKKWVSNIMRSLAPRQWNDERSQIFYMYKNSSCPMSRFSSSLHGLIALSLSLSHFTASHWIRSELASSLMEGSLNFLW